MLSEKIPYCVFTYSSCELELSEIEIHIRNPAQYFFFAVFHEAGTPGVGIVQIHASVNRNIQIHFTKCQEGRYFVNPSLLQLVFTAIVF